MGDSEREGRDFITGVKWFLTLGLVAFILYQAHQAPIPGSNTQATDGVLPPNTLPPTAEPLSTVEPTSQSSPTPQPEGQTPQTTQTVVQPAQEVTFDDVIQATEPIPIVDVETQEQRFTHYKPMYENLLNNCISTYGLPDHPNFTQYMLALIKNTYIGRYGEIKLVYSSDFDPLFVRYGLDAPDKKVTSFAQVCVGYTILLQAIASQESVMAGFAEYNGGIQAGWWWNQYVRTLSPDGQWSENAEAAAIAYLKFRTIGFDQNYTRLKAEYMQSLATQGYDEQKRLEIIQRVETFLQGVALTLYP